ncbi:alpha/beta hydrolase family esterase [Acuticoccus kandeliae]|uniref:alpha/beta hydrolase family esterase n=1 Tax=Acuticoccus kandeliae TaxID=2073160 RepID=UPI001B3B668B|nr:prolyl oligopeptidase family serine peptidase [Acuticoccus kandeliae]
MPILRAAMLTIAALLAYVPAASACGPDTDCTIGDRTYRIAVPEGEGPFGAILFMHGYRGTAEGVMKHKELREVAAERGLALVAAKSGGEDWLIRNAPRKGLTDDAAELAYFDALLDALVTEHEIDPDRILATGFSAGGMMTWTLACRRPDRFKAFLPMSGTFWAPLPDDCTPEPVDLVHIHGTADTVVPIAGRAIADTSQGDVRDAIALFGTAGGYDRPPLRRVPPTDLGLACTGAAREDGKALLYCLHDGGHMFRPEWVAWAADTFLAP